MKFIHKAFLSIAFILFIVYGNSQTAQRKAFMGLYGSAVEGGIRIDSLVTTATLHAFGLRKDDVLTKMNGKNIRTMQEYQSIATTIRTHDELSIEYLRKGKQKKVTGKALMKPYETSGIADIIYDWVPFRSGRLRTMTYRPKNKDHVPCILLIPGYNCGSIENFTTSYNGKLINEWIKAGYAVVTIEKSGVGDSYRCTPCVEADMQTDIESFDAGYNYMEQLSFVNKQQLFIWGHSMGGVIAPEIAKNHKPAGIIAFATVFRPWNEFLPEMHRVQSPLDGKTYIETEAFVREIEKVYHEFFVNKLSPQQIHAIPAYRAMAESDLEYKEGNTTMWGRHWKFWQQIDSLNLADSWSKVQCPVLSIFGGADYIACSELEHFLITETVNTAHPGNGTHITIPDIDHIMVRNKDWKSSHKNIANAEYRNANFHYGIAEETVKWMDEVR